MSAVYRLARSALFKLDAEKAHELSIRALKSGLIPRRNQIVDPRLRVEIAGVSFPNPLGLAAGYDKNAQVPDALLRLGFGFVEVGTVTPLPQAGNERPRIFRLPEQGAVINRLGFNNDGHADALARLNRRRHKAGIVGVNIGANKDSQDRIQDYVMGIHRFESVAAYLVVNVSSPNTPGLRRLQGGEDLDRLLENVIAARNGAAAVAAARPCPVFLKVAPDLAAADVGAIADAAKRYRIDGLVVSNTTLSRAEIEGFPAAAEAGGLSGRPLMRRSTYVLAAFRRALGPDMPIIGVGGVEDAHTAIAKIEAGADLVQLYTSLIYGGPGLPLEILAGMVAILDRTAVSSIRELRDRTVDEVLERGPLLEPPSEAGSKGR